MELAERYRGSLLGLAVGDAVGAPAEFGVPGAFEPVRGMAGGGTHQLKAGEWTDDTSLALCLAESLIDRGGFDPADQLDRYLQWYRNGHLSSTGRCFDIGDTTRAALERFESTRAPYCGPTGPNTASNGSIMRLAPVPLLYAASPADAIERAGESSRTTHGAAESVDACRYLAGLIVGAVSGEPKDALLSGMYTPVSGYWALHPLAPRVEEVAAGSFKRRSPPDIAATGRAVKTLEAALWAFHRTDTFEAGCLMAVNLGQDADTAGAVYGQLAGAYYGAKLIPSAWLAELAYRTLIETFADRILEIAMPFGSA